MLEEILRVFSIAGIFSVLDSFSTPHLKRVISDYTFGIKDIPASAFERSAARVWISAFFDQGRVRIFRIFLISLLSTLILLTLTSRTSDFEILEGNDFHIVMIAVLVLSAAQIPFEIINLIISRQIYQAWAKNLNFVVQLILDIALTSIVTTGISACLFLIVSKTTFMPEDTYSSYIAVIGGVLAISSISSSTLFFLSRIAMLVSAALIRSIVIFSKINLRIAMHSSVHDSPLTFISLFTCAIWKIAEYVIGKI